MQQPLKIATTVHDFVVDKSGCPIFTPKEFGDLLGVSVQTVNRWDRSGYLVAYRATYNGRVYRYYTQKQYDDFVASSDYLQLNHVKNSDLIDATIGKLHIVDFSEAARKKAIMVVIFVNATVAMLLNWRGRNYCQVSTNRAAVGFMI